MTVRIYILCTLFIAVIINAVFLNYHIENGNTGLAIVSVSLMLACAFVAADTILKLLEGKPK